MSDPRYDDRSSRADEPSDTGEFSNFWYISYSRGQWIQYYFSHTPDIGDDPLLRHTAILSHHPHHIVRTPLQYTRMMGCPSDTFDHYGTCGFFCDRVSISCIQSGNTLLDW